MNSLLIATCAALVAPFAADAQTKKFPINATLQATVQHAPGAQTFDVLIPGVETITLDLMQSGASTFLIKTTDYNADGYRDIAFTARSADGADTRYEIFLYHPDVKTFESLETPGDGICENLMNVRTSPTERTLTVSCAGAGGKRSSDVYRWADPFTLALVRSTDNTPGTAADRAADKADAKAERDEARRSRRAAADDADEEE